MSTLQKWLTGLIGLSALVIVASNPVGVATALDAGQRFISGTDRTAMGR